MIAFFFTIPISISRPTMAIRLKSMPNSCSARRAPMTADGRPVRIVKDECNSHTYPSNDVDREDSAEQQKALVRDRILEGLGVARKGGRQPAGISARPSTGRCAPPRRRARRRPEGLNDKSHGRKLAKLVDRQ